MYDSLDNFLRKYKSLRSSNDDLTSILGNFSSIFLINNNNFYLNNAEQIRDFIPIEDVAQKFLKDLIKKDENYFDPEIKNICTGKGISILEFDSRILWKKK